MRIWLGAAVAAAMALGVGAASAEDVKFANIGELSGAGAVSSTNWRDGVTLAIEELNAKGGLLGRRIALTNYDDQTNPGMARAQMQKAIDEDPYVILGPIFSGMVKDRPSRRARR
jgi:branched-chain amino acid transport system substrate-binding protein